MVAAAQAGGCAAWFAPQTRALLTADANDIHPTPKQREADHIADRCDEFLYGGAAGGGGGSAATGGAESMESVWKEVSKTRRKGFRVFVAGALDPSNVREAIRRTHAFAVDVSRGVERAPGVKDPDALARFFAEARA